MVGSATMPGDSLARCPLMLTVMLPEPAFTDCVTSRRGMTVSALAVAGAISAAVTAPAVANAAAVTEILGVMYPVLSMRRLSLANA